MRAKLAKAGPPGSSGESWRVGLWLPGGGEWGGDRPNRSICEAAGLCGRWSREGVIIGLPGLELAGGTNSSGGGAGGAGHRGGSAPAEPIRK